MEQNEYPLHIATKFGNLNEVQQLIDAGAIINEVDSDGFTSLHVAANSKHIEVAEYLLTHGADVNEIDTFEWSSPLHFATRNNDLEMVRLFTEAGADMQCSNMFGDMPIHFAAELGYVEIVKHFLEHGMYVDIIKPGSKMTPLHRAADSKHIKVAKYLLDHGANVNPIETYNGWSPLHFATNNNDLEMVRLFTEAGANMQCSNSYGHMPIHVAAEGGYVEIVKHFLENGIYVDITNQSNKMTPLHMAASGGYIEVVDYLLFNKANVRLKDCEKRGPIHLGVIAGNVKVVHGLIEKGADMDAKDIFKMTPLDLTCRHGNLEIAQLLLKNGAVFNLQEGSRNYSPLHWASQTCSLEIVKYFISLGVDANFGTIQEYTLLHVAAKWDHITMVKYLVEMGADVNKKTLRNGATPLYYAIKSICTDVAEFLILNGADLKEAEYKGKSTLSIALKDVSSDYPESDQTQYMVLAKLIIKYTVLIYNPNPNEKFIRDGCPFFKELSQYFNDCQKEITSMARVTIKNSTVSLHQIISGSNKGNAFVQYLYNDDIKNELENIEDYLKDFSIYGNIFSLVQLRVKQGFQRMELLTDADLMLKKVSPKLPSEIRWRVFNYLDMTDLKTVIQSDFI
uniref:Ankyrin-2-like n=1 Tax=Diabrotica virgifera virgifera TaxID=50390 RepID=A0A6P7GHN0_DIAVI